MAEIPHIADNPFKRNEQFVRKGIRPQSSPAEITWEKPKVIKSKQEDRKVEKPPSKSKISFPGLKKNKKKTEEKDETHFHNPSYQQQLELSKFMHQLDAKNQNERIVVGSESGNVSYEDQSGTLSGVHVGPPKSPVQKFSGAVDLDSATSSAISGKSPKKKKLVLKVKSKFKGKKNKDSTDGKDIETNVDEKDDDNIAQNKSNLYSEVNRESKDETKNTSIYENVDNFRDAEKSKANDTDSIIYDNNKLCKIIDESEIESETSRINDVTKDVSVSGKEEEHYKEPTKVITISSGSGQSPDGETDSVEMGYQDARSKLRKVEKEEGVEQSNEKRGR